MRQWESANDNSANVSSVTFYVIITGYGKGGVGYSWYSSYPANWLRVADYREQPQITLEGVNFRVWDIIQHKYPGLYFQIAAWILADEGFAQ